MGNFEIIQAEDLRKGNFEIKGILTHEFKDVLRLIDKNIKIARKEDRHRSCIQIPKRFFNIDKYRTKLITILNTAGYSVEMRFCTRATTYIVDISW